MYSGRRLKEALFTVTIITLSVAAIAPVLHIVYTVLVNGVSVIVKAGLRFFTDLPPTPGSAEVGGIAPAIAGTILITAIAFPLSVVLGLFSAILTTEFPKNPLSLLVDTIARSLASVPTIAISMVIYTVIVVPMRSFSALASALALTIVALPYTYTYFSAALRSVPAMYREAAFSLGMSRWDTVTRVLIPISRRIIAAGALTTLARIMGETAALLFTAGRFRGGVAISLTAPVDAIPLLIFDYILSPYEIWHEVAWGASALLLLSYLAIFMSVKLMVKEVKL